MNKVLASLNTLQASWLTLIMARLFGEKRVVFEGNTRIVTRKYKGKEYLISASEGDICDNLFHIGKSCDELYDCCDCGGNDCGCGYCFSCHACEHCL